MFKLFKKQQVFPADLLTSSLHDQDTFYPRFMRDLDRCRHVAIIESPFISSTRITKLLPTLKRLRQRNVAVVINTREPNEHEYPWSIQASEALGLLQNIGVRILYTGNHHRKIAILDGCILWEGSLNILSQGMSCEVMRRIESQTLAQQMIVFTKLDKFIH